MIFSHTKTGLYHVSNGLPCGDVTDRLDLPGLTCIALADGVSACTYGHIGARIAVDTVIRLFEKCADIIWKLSNERICSLVYAEVRYAVDSAAASEGVPYAEYSSTLAFAVHNRKCGQVLLFSLGDGAAVIYGASGSVRVPCHPYDNGGEVMTTTTDDWYRSAYISRTDASEIRRVMLLSDGGWYRAKDVICGTLTDAPETLVYDAIERSTDSDDSSFISADMICGK